MWYKCEKKLVRVVRDVETSSLSMWMLSVSRVNELFGSTSARFAFDRECG